MKKPVFFRIFKDSDLIGVKQFLSEQVVLGREATSDVVLEDESVSPIHAMVEERDEGYFVCDLGSSSGTFRNGQQVLDTNIENGDELQLGAFRIEFYIGIPKPKGKPPGADVKADKAGDSKAAEVKPAEVIPIEMQEPVSKIIPKSDPKKSGEPVQTKSTDIPLKQSSPGSGEKKVEKPAEQKPTDQKNQDQKAKDQKPNEQKNTEAKPKEEKAKLPENAPKKEEPKSQHSVSKGTTGKSPTVSAKAEPEMPRNRVHRETSSQGSGLEMVGSTEFTKKRTFAPPDQKDPLNRTLAPTKGTVVEVVLGWGNRVIGTYHFDERRTVTIGANPKNDIILPVFSTPVASMPLLKIEALATVFLGQSTQGHLIRPNQKISLQELVAQGKIPRTPTGFMLTIQQEEMVELELEAGLSIFVRYVAPTPKPLMAPLLDLKTSELMTLVIAAIFLGVLSLYLMVYAPGGEEEAPTDETLRVATVVFPKKKEELPPPPPEEKKPVGGTPNPEKRPVEVKGPPIPNPETNKPVEAAPNKSNSQEKKLTAKTIGKGQGVPNAKETSQQKTTAAPQKTPVDVKTKGILSTFARGGTQNKLNTVLAGSNQVGEGAKSAAGKAGFGEGDNPNANQYGLKEVGQGGTGVATVGISGVKTAGRAGGNASYGDKDLGGVKRASIIPGGAEEEFKGTIDREAIRRVIQANLRQIRACYERALNKEPGLHGKIVLEWIIIDEGRVKDARVKTTTMGNTEVEECSISRLRTWRFPSPPRNQEALVAYPFVFAPQN